MIKQTQLTKAGLEALQKELEELINIKRPKVVERLSFARSQGDLSENNDYQNARDDLEFLDGRIAELTGVVKNAVVVGGNSKKGEVCLGTRVTLKYNGNKTVFSIVGEWEADPVAKKISHTSPLGQALVGKKIGEKVEVQAPAGRVKYEILAIE